MTTIAGPMHPQTCFADQRLLRGATIGAKGSFSWLWIITSVITGVVFFIAGHDLLTSRAVAFTQSADEMQAAALGGNLARRAGFLMLGGLGVVLWTTGNRRLAVHWTLVAPLGALVALAAASVLWTSEPAMCGRRLFVLFSCLLAAGGVARAFSLREIAWVTIAVVGSFVAIGIAAEAALGTFRPWAGDYRFAGTVHPNTQGPALAALCLAAIALGKDAGRYRPLLWAMFLSGVVLLVLTKSRTATAALVAAAAVIQTVRLPARRQLVGGALVAFGAIAGLWIVWICGLDPFSDFREIVLLGRSSESETLSGRAFIWPELIHFARERFWLGYGYEAFWTPARIETISDELGWGLREAHNGYLEMWLWLGATGVLLMLMAAAMAMAAAVRGFRATGDSNYFLPLGLLVFAICNACLESGVVVVSLVPFILGCCVLRLALFDERTVSEWPLSLTSRYASLRPSCNHH
jgi:exopolysaccharide production protein ExoQ